MVLPVLHIVHDPAWTDCRIADAARARGYAVEHVCPPAGDDLPPIEGHAALVVGGSAEGHAGRPDELKWVADEISYIRKAVDAGVPMLGICMGAQLLAAAFGGKVAGRADGMCELGFFRVEATAEGMDLFEASEHFYQAHYEGVMELPDNAVLLARGDRFPIQAFRIGESAFGTQFHPDMKTGSLSRESVERDPCRDRPGAQDIEEQLRLAAVHEASIQEWTDRFVDRWLGHAAQAPLAA